MKIEKDLYITEVRISKVLNAPYVIDAVGEYENRFTLGEKELEAWGIVPSREILGRNLVVTLDSIPLPKQPKPTELLIDHIEKVERKMFRLLPEPVLSEEIEYRLKLQTPRGESTSLPCPNFELTLDLNESEYREFKDLEATTALKISCRIR